MAPIWKKKGKGEKRNSPPHNDLVRVDLLMEVKHRTVVLHVHLNLFRRLVMGHREAVPDLDLAFGTGAEEGSNHSRLFIVASKEVVEDAKESDGVDMHAGERAGMQHARTCRGREVEVERRRGRGFCERHGWGVF